MSSAKRLTIIAALCVAFLSGAGSQLLVSQEARAQADVIVGLIVVVMVFIWYRLDSSERDYPRSGSLNVAVIALAIIAVPYYLFRSRGTSKGAMATLMFAGLVIAYLVVSFGGIAIGYWLARSNLRWSGP